MKPLSQTRQAIVEELVKIAVNWGADEYMSDGLRTLESDLSQVLNDYTQSIIEMVEGKKNKVWMPKGVEIEDDLTTIEGVTKHQQKMIIEAHRADASYQGYNQALNDIKEELQG